MREPKSPETHTPGSDQYHFHYNREERVSLAGDSLGRVDHRSWFRKNRGNVLLIIDILLIIIIFIIFNTFLKPDPSTSENETHQFQLRAIQFGNEILATVKIRALEDLVSGSPGTVQVSVETASGRENSDEFAENEWEIRELLPDTRDRERIVRFRLPGELLDTGQDVPVIVARIITGIEEIILRRQVELE